jgi:hypothetical protein
VAFKRNGLTLASLLKLSGTALVLQIENAVPPSRDFTGTSQIPQLKMPKKLSLCASRQLKLAKLGGWTLC